MVKVGKELSENRVQPPTHLHCGHHSMLSSGVISTFFGTYSPTGTNQGMGMTFRDLYTQVTPSWNKVTTLTPPNTNAFLSWIFV